VHPPIPATYAPRRKNRCCPQQQPFQSKLHALSIPKYPPTLPQAASFHQRFPPAFLCVIRRGRLPGRSPERSPELSFSRRLVRSWYSAKSSFAWLSCFIVFHESHLGPYPFQRTRYLVVPSGLVLWSTMRSSSHSSSESELQYSTGPGGRGTRLKGS